MDEGVTWSMLGNDLPDVVVTSLALDEANEILYAGTYGRSFFSCEVKETLGTFTPYGAGLKGSGGFVPDLFGSGKVQYGSPISIDLAGGLGGTNGFLYIGLNAAALPFLGGTLLVFPFNAAVPIVLAGQPGVPGDGSFTLTGTPYITGLSIYLQVLLADPGAVKGVSMSNGLEIAFP